MGLAVQRMCTRDSTLDSLGSSCCQNVERKAANEASFSTPTQLPLGAFGLQTIVKAAPVPTSFAGRLKSSSNGTSIFSQFCSLAGESTSPLQIMVTGVLSYGILRRSL